MENPRWSWDEAEKLLSEIEALQEARVFACGKRIIPQLTNEDMLQPNDYPQLENHPHFRYEEGVLEGIRTVQMALRAQLRNKNHPVH